MPAAPPSQPPQPDAAPDRCTFEHPLFSRLGEVMFRLAEADGMPCLVMPMGRSTAALPLRSLQAEFGIGDASADGQMLALVARSLDFVTALRSGDPLPVEVSHGTASWQPSPRHQELAASRLKLQLVSQLGADTAADWNKAEPQAMLAAAKDPGLRLSLQAAYVEAAALLGLPDAAAVARLAEAAADELSYIEALRDWLLRRVLQLAERLRRLASGASQNLPGLELLSRVTRLTDIALGRINARFADVEGQTESVLDALRVPDAWRVLIRLHRDWLHCSLRGWEPILTAWDHAAFDWSDGTWSLLGRTYRFLAVRFMPVQEWQAVQAKLRGDEPNTRMVW